MQTTLLLDAFYQPLGIIGWQKAITLLLQEKAEVVKESGEYIRSVSMKVNIPSVLRLVRRRYEKYKASFSKRSIYLRDKGRCAYCATPLSMKSLTLDHVRPKCQGGGHNWLNVGAACKACNNKKAGRTPGEAKMRLLTEPRVPTRMELIRQAIEEFGLQGLLADALKG